MRTIVLIGLLGGFTTFSSFGLQTFTLLRDGGSGGFQYCHLKRRWPHDGLGRLLIVEIVDSLENIEKFLPLLDELIKDGLVTIEQVRVIHYRA